MSDLIQDGVNAQTELSQEPFRSRLKFRIGQNNMGLSYGRTRTLEMDFSESEAPVKIAVTDHTFVIDGWVTDDRSKEVIEALNPYCQHIEYEPVKPTILDHHHHDHHSSEPKPPVAFGDHGASAPMELLTDAIGRSDYGKMDPTVFMLFSYPLFFGLMLGDMAYGLLTISLGVIIRRSFPEDSANHSLGISGCF